MLDIAGIRRRVLWLPDNSEHIRGGDEGFDSWETVVVWDNQYLGGADTSSGDLWVGDMGG
jgi:hypothetical protein